jgi:cytochrome o ubiquinol oxidase subunit 1
MSHFDDMSLQIWFQVSAFGAVLIALGIASFLIQLVVSYRNRVALRDVTGDPWDGRTLEWSTASPPPDYNFAFTPVVHELDAWHDMKVRGHKRPVGAFKPIHMPKNTAAGFVISMLCAGAGFAVVWHMWLFAVLFSSLTLIFIILHTFNYKRDFYITAAQVTSTENQRTALLMA